ncbi:hypothetical protein ACFXPI_01185 [Streptomyces sp. NPDC059104]|uniref:hypothetical protein n=1 Tax=Streptomyces sp. NPDC059104 TaxID=3346729 RepID=UPI00368F2138
MPAVGWSRDFEAGALTSSIAGELLKAGQREWFGNPGTYNGTARIITHEPHTATDLTPKGDTTLTWFLQAVSYDLPVGHRLALVVNSRDPLYSYAGSDLPALTTTTVGSVSGSEARLELPLG